MKDGEQEQLAVQAVKEKLLFIILTKKKNKQKKLIIGKSFVICYFNRV